MTATGDLWIHGVTAAKRVRIVARFQGPPDAPSSVKIATVEPFELSLEAHDVKPRDLAGKFLKGGLERVGKKIIDTAQVSLEFTATTKPAP